MSWTLLRVNISLKDFTVIGCEDNFPTWSTYIYWWVSICGVPLIYLKDPNATIVAYDELKLDLSCFSALPLPPAYKKVIPLCCLQKWYSYTLPTNRLFLYSCGKITKIACSSYKAKGGIISSSRIRAYVQCTLCIQTFEHLNIRASEHPSFFAGSKHLDI